MKGHPELFEEPGMNPKHPSSSREPYKHGNPSAETLRQ